MAIFKDTDTIARPESPGENIDSGHVYRNPLVWILFVVSFIVYGDTLWNGYAYDDVTVITHNTFVQKGISGIPDILQTPRLYGFQQINEHSYRPVSLVMFALEHEIAGNRPVVGHFFNILFFAGCVVLLFLFLNSLTDGKRTGLAFLAALLFAVHPIHTEVVANIKSRDELACFFFGFLALNLFEKYVRTGKIRALISGGLSLLLAYLSKETVISFVALVPFIFYLFGYGDRRRSHLILGVTAGATVIFLLWRWAILSGYGTDAVPLIDNPLVAAQSCSTRFATAISVLGAYLRLLIVPYPLICNYWLSQVPFRNFTDVPVIISAIAYAALVATCIFRLSKNKRDLWSLGIFFYLATIAMFSNIPFLVGAEMAERFLFFGSAGYCLIVALLLEKLLSGAPIVYPNAMKKIQFSLVAGLLVLSYSTLTVARNVDWKDNMTLFESDLAKSPDDRRLNESLAREIMANIYPGEPDAEQKKKLLEKSIGCFSHVAGMYPGDILAQMEAAKTWLVAGNYDSAAHYALRALAINPGQPVSNFFLAEVYFKSGRYAPAIRYYQRSLPGLSDKAGISNSIATCYWQLHQYDSAIQGFQKTLLLSPGYADALFNIGMCYLAEQKKDSATAYLKKELSVHPENVNAMNNLGGLLYQSGEYEPAAALFSKLVAADPKNALGWSNLGHCYFKMARYDSAIAALNKSLVIDHSYTPDITMLAAAYRASGNATIAQKYEAVVAGMNH